MPIALPSTEYLHECFDLPTHDGVLYWKNRPLHHFTRSTTQKGFNVQFATKPAGIIDPRGYVRVKIDGKTYAAHRIVWKMATGSEPPELDHIDRVRSNNSPANLRPATRQENCVNKGPRSDNASGLKGVSPHARGGWRARIFLNGKSVNLGRFENPEDAAVAYMVACADAHGIQQAIAPDHREACEAFFLSLAQTDVQNGKRTLPGFIVHHERRAV